MSGWGSIISAAIPAAASIGSAYLGASAAGDAAKTQQRAADQAAGITQSQMDLQERLYGRNLDLQRQIFDQSRADLEPWRQAGTQALGALQAGTGATYQQSPSYAFRRAEGMRGIDAGMAARGLYNSSARDRAGARFADGLASQDYDQWWNRQAALAGIGQSATGQGIQAGQQFAGASQNAANTYGANSGQIANSLASIYGQAGNAAAAGQIGQANAWGGAFNNLANQDWRGVGKAVGSWF